MSNIGSYIVVSIIALVIGWFVPLALAMNPSYGYIATVAWVVWGGALAIFITSFGVMRRLPCDSDSIPRYHPGYQVLKLWGGIGTKRCGCVYGRGHQMDKPESETVVEDDESPVWERSQAGAKVVYKRYDETLKRCTLCGDYYHVMEPTNITHTIWKDEALPDAVYETDYPIVDGAVEAKMEVES